MFLLDPHSDEFKQALAEVQKKGQMDKIGYNFVVRPGSTGILPVTQDESTEYLRYGEYDERLQEIEREEFLEDLPMIESEAELRAVLQCLNG